MVVYRLNYSFCCARIGTALMFAVAAQPLTKTVRYLVRTLTWLMASAGSLRNLFRVTVVTARDMLRVQPRRFIIDISVKY